MGGGRAVIGVLLGVAIVAAAVFAGSRWLPKPEKKIEWVHSAESVIVQVKTSGGDDPLTGSINPLRPPRFTLYGDGTIIVADTAKGCSATIGVCETLWAGKLSGEQVSDLLKFISDTGFFDFTYTQPQPPVQGAPTVYIYVAAKEAQNAVSANALGWEQDGAEWSQFRKLRNIEGRLGEIGSNVVAGSRSLAPEEGLLQIDPVVPNDTVGVPVWPYPQIDIAAAAPARDTATYHLPHDELMQLQLQDASTTTCWCQIQYQGRAFNVYYRPVLPHEDNFPEFEPPTQ